MANKKYEVMFSIAGKVAASFNSAFKGANKAIDDANKRTKALKENMANLQDIAKKGLAIGGAGLAGAGFLAKEAMSAESAMAEFKKVFSGTEKELVQFQKDFLKISSETGKSFVDIANIGAAAAQAGIKSTDIKAFTNDAVKMGIAFDITAEEAGQSMAEMRTAFKLSQDQVRELADKINLLGNTTPQAANKIMEITQRVGPLANLANISAENVAALGSSMVSLEPDVAATAIKKVISSLTAGSSASKSMREAYSELGLDVEKVSKAVQKDSTKTMLTVLQAIQKLPKDKQVANLSNIFGLEGIGGTSQLADNLPNLIKNLNAVSEANKNGKDGWNGSMLDEYNSRAATTEFALARMKESWRNVGITIGMTFLPAITKAAEWMGKIAEKVSTWAEKNPELTAQLSKWGVILAGVITGVSALSIGLVTFIGPIMMVVGALSKFGFIITIIKSVGTAFLWLGRIFLMNPIGLAITAVIAVIWLLWKNWDTVCKYVGIAWEGIKGFFTSGISNISATIVNWSPIGLFYRAFSAVMNWFGVSLPSTFTEFGRNLLQGLANGIKNGVSAAVNAAGEAVEAVKNKVKNFFGINSPSKLFAQFGEWNMEGLAIGMQAGAPMAENASDKALSGVLPKANGQSLTNNSSMNNNYTVNIQQTIQGGNDVAEQAKQGALSAIDEFKSYNNRNKRTSFA